MIRNSIILIVALILSGCHGGLSGIMTSSGAGHYQIYRINPDPEYVNKFDQSTKGTIEDLLKSLWFEKKHAWGKPLLKDYQVSTFQRKYKGHYVNIDVQISEEHIIFMSTSYSSITEKIFNNLEAELNRKFGRSNIEECYSIKTLYIHNCFENSWG